MIENKKIIITGGAGFIGSSLVRALSPKNDVSVIDNYISGKPQNHVQAAKYIYGQASQINEMSLDYQYDYVFHFGEYSRVEQSFDDPNFVIQNNSAIPNILHFCERANAKLIYSCSSTVLSDTNSETSLSPYTLTKDLNRKLINNYCKWRDINYSIVYFYNAYGENEIEDGPYATVVAKFLKLKREGAKTVPVHKPGTQRRNFTFIKDIVEGILIAAEKGSGDGYGIGSDKSFSIIELCNMMGLQPELIESRQGNRLHSPLKNQEIKQLGWIEYGDLPEFIKGKLS